MDLTKKQILLQENPSKRLPLPELAEHPFMVRVLPKVFFARKRMAAVRIHRFWRDVTHNPAFAYCRRRLMTICANSSSCSDSDSD